MFLYNCMQCIDGFIIYNDMIEKVTMQRTQQLLPKEPILVPRGRAPFGQHQKSRPLATSGPVQYRKSAIHGLPVTLRMLWVKYDKSNWFWCQSIVFTKPFKTGMSLDRARGRDSWCWPKGARPQGTRMRKNRKNPVTCNACVVARKIETDCFSRNVPISNDPVVRISRWPNTVFKCLFLILHYF